MKILICDDDRDFRAMLYFHLHKKGHEVLAVSDAVHAVALLGDPDHRIDVVIMDLTMPRLSGVEIMETFVKWSMCKTSFIVVSGNLDPHKFDTHEHVVGTLAKPFNLAALDEMIEKAAQSPNGS